MSVIGSLQNLAGFARIRTSSTPAPGLKPYATVDVDGRIESLRARTQLLRLYRSLEGLADASGVQARLNLGSSSAQSSSGLSLDLTQAAATLASDGEINDALMSFSPFGPDWGGGSTAEITIGGVYDGTHGSGDLTFEVRRAGTRGVDNLRIRAYDPNGDRINNYNIRTNHALDQQYDLENGLYFTVGNGDVINRDTAIAQISDSIGADVNPDNPLGGIRNSNPNLQFGGPSIVNGQFTINGETISVATTDSLSDVVNRINLSAAGVTAAFDAASDSIDFTHNTIGAAGTIDLQGDTSNFLAATKLDSINVVSGITPDNLKALDQVAAFSSVTSGNITINNTQISVDTTVDSLDDVIARINASSAGVIASFDPASQNFLLETQGESGPLAVNGNATGLFTALNLLENHDYSSAGSGRGFSKARSYRIADSLADVVADLNDVFKGPSSVNAPLGSAIRAAFGDSFGTEIFGLLFDDTTEARNYGRFGTIDRGNLTASLQQRGDAVSSLLNDRNGQSGLINGLLTATRQALTGVNSTLNIRDTVINTFA
jgi:hypothetical protein